MAENWREMLTFSRAREKPIHRWFHYKEGFSPEFVKLVAKGREGTLLDPFCGSGTSLVAANEMGIPSLGLDVSELSVFVANEKVRAHSQAEIEELLEFVRKLKTFKEAVDWRFELFPVERAFPKRNLLPILRTRAAIEALGPARNLALLALVAVLPMCSYVVKEGGVLKIDRRKRVGDFTALYKRKVKHMVEDIQKWEGQHLGKALLADARMMPLEDESISTIVTSPPYLNNVDYSKIYGLELSLLTLDYNAPRKVRQRLFPSFQTSKGSFGEHREMVANAYFDATRRVWEEFWRVLEPGGKVAYNVSNAVIHGHHIAVDEEVMQIAESLGFSAEIKVAFVRKTRVGTRIISANESVIFAEKPK